MKKELLDLQILLQVPLDCVKKELLEIQIQILLQVPLDGVGASAAH